MGGVGIAAGGKSRVNYRGGVFTVESGFENHPVTYVSWCDAAAFANYHGWRLPTESEWESVDNFNEDGTYASGSSLHDSERFLVNLLSFAFGEELKKTNVGRTQQQYRQTG